MCKLCRERVGGERAGSDGRRRAAEGWRGGGSRAAVGLTRCGRHWASGRRGDAVSTRKHARLASTRAPSVFGTRHEDRVREFCRIVFCSHANTPSYSKSPHTFSRTEAYTHTHARAHTSFCTRSHIVRSASRDPRRDRQSWCGFPFVSRYRPASRLVRVSRRGSRV